MSLKRRVVCQGAPRNDGLKPHCMTRWGKKSIMGFTKVALLGSAMSCLQMLLVHCKCGREATKRHPGDPLRGREALEKTSPAKERYKVSTTDGLNYSGLN